MHNQMSEVYQPVSYKIDSAPGYLAIVARICDKQWSILSENEILRVAHAYHYFSIQFRENLDIACLLYPDDADLKHLHLEECDTANLSPWPGVAEPGEKLDHDMFMDRLLRLQPMDGMDDLKAAGEAYLSTIRAMGNLERAKSIASYEDTGLSRVFSAILQAPHWDGPALRAFQHFLIRHVEFDSCSDGGHGLLTGILLPDDTIEPLWKAFEDILACAVPRMKMTEVSTV